MICGPSSCLFLQYCYVFVRIWINDFHINTYKCKNMWEAFLLLSPLLRSQNRFEQSALICHSKRFICYLRLFALVFFSPSSRSLYFDSFSIVFGSFVATHNCNRIAHHQNKKRKTVSCISSRIEAQRFHWLYKWKKKRRNESFIRCCLHSFVIFAYFIFFDHSLL